MSSTKDIPGLKEAERLVLDDVAAHDPTTFREMYIRLAPQDLSVGGTLSLAMSRLLERGELIRTSASQISLLR